MHRVFTCFYGKSVSYISLSLSVYIYDDIGFTHSSGNPVYYISTYLYGTGHPRLPSMPAPACSRLAYIDTTSLQIYMVQDISKRVSRSVSL